MGIEGPGRKEGPYDVLVYMTHRGDRINADGDPWPGEHIPKLVIFTRRGRNTIDHRVWSEAASKEMLDTGYATALEEGCVFHQFDVGDPDATEKALEAHRSMEKSSEIILEHLRKTA